MAYSLDDVLGYQHLTAAVQLTKSGLPDILPPAFFTTTEKVSGDKASYVQTYGQRKLARRIPYGAPPRAVEKLAIGQKELRLLNFRETMPFNHELFNIFRQWEAYAMQQQYALDQVRYQAEGFQARFMNIRKAVVMSTVATGAIYIDADGGLLPDATSAVVTIDQGIPANNKGQLNGIVSASWSDPATNIVEQIRNIHSQAIRNSGYPLKYAVYGKNVAGYITNNSMAKTFFPFAAGGDYALDLALRGTLPKGMMGLEWIPAQSAYFEKEDGTQVDQFPADQVTFLPEIDKTTYTLFEGSTLVPSQFGIFNDVMTAFKSAKEVFGAGGYAKWMDPMAIHGEYFDVFLPHFKVPASVFILDTTI